jgi:asparagine synthase (glutamine-hydrolysing)
MGSFFILLSTPEGAGHGAPQFHAALGLARRIAMGPPSGTYEANGARVASFPRKNRSGSAVLVDPLTGNWLVAMGTWFHRDGFAVGEELRLLEDFRKSGVRNLANKLEGFFVIAIGEPREETVYVITDLVGSCHCYWRPSDGGIAISGSSFLLAALEETPLDPVACQEFLATGAIYEDRSLFLRIRKLPPASIYRFVQGVIKSKEPYWQISEIAADSLDLRTAEGNLWEVLAESASKIKKVFPSPVCDLTGGYDSRALVAALHAAHLPISTVVSGSPDSPDVVISKGLAAMARLPHRHLQKSNLPTFDQLQGTLALTDGEYDLIEYSRIQAVHEELSGHFDISINGSFGELARGYWWELLVPRTGSTQPLPAHKVAARRYAVGLYDLSLFSEESRLDLVEHFSGAIDRAIEGLAGRPNTLQMDQVYLRLRMHRWQGRIASSTNRIWPCLSPFMFRSVLEVMLRAHWRARRNNLLIRDMLSKFTPDWANFPLEDGAPCLPVTWKNFYRFAPLGSYYVKKIMKRAARLSGMAYGARSSPSNEPARIHLWSEEEVRSTLEPGTMCLRDLLLPERLSAFLRSSESRDFIFDAQWNRLLTLECTLRALIKAREWSG